MKKRVFYFFALLLLLSGCANLGQMLGETDTDYHFRKTRWGFSQERVELAEAGNPVFQRTANELVYKHRISGVYCKLVYTFKDNKLRTAGYVTETPVENADNLIREAVNKHGMPTDEAGNMVWKNLDTVIYANVYTSVKKQSMTKYEYSSGGLLQDILKKNLMNRNEAGTLVYLDGVFAYIDRTFYDE
ncbi:MAG: hypothetical protein OXU51_18870, partial [Candidatus Poribacteria bacterium]|nr:hypothetical protein [Candidatus Poribacteria bacterium]